MVRQVLQEVVQRKRKGGEEEDVQLERAKIRKTDLCGSSEGNEDSDNLGSDEYDSDSSVHTQDLLNLFA